MKRLHTAVLSAAAGTGHTVRIVRSIGRYLPGWAGAGLVSWGIAEVYVPAGIIAAGIFLLAVDQRLPPRASAPRDEV